jgi:hypothetical protein
MLHLEQYVDADSPDNGGQHCTAGSVQPIPLTTTMAWVPSASGYALMIYGQVSPTVAQLQLVGPSGAPAPVPLNGGYYLTSLQTSAPNTLPGDAVLRAIDAGGGLVGSLDLQTVIDRSRPPLP